MRDALSFRLRLKRGAAFTLEIEEQVPLRGITAVTGASGSGKTTLLRALAGLDAENFGQRDVSFRERTWDDESQSVAPEERRVGMVFQEPALFPHMNVAQNIDYGARRRKVRSTDAIVEALDLGALMQRGVPGLSGGEARRVALARALASDPMLLLLDEPMSGLDDARKSEFLPYVARAVSAARVPTIYVSHAADEVLTLADRILALRDGRSLGWQAPPMRLSGVVTGRSDLGVTVGLHGADGDVHEFPLLLRAFVGERVGLGLSPDSILISADNPGPGTALVTLPAELVQTSGDRGTKTVRVCDQELRLPSGLKLPEGATRFWLSILRALPRPEGRDSEL